MPLSSLNNQQERANLEAVEKMKFQIKVIQVDEPSADSPPGQERSSPPTNQARKIEESPNHLADAAAAVRRASLGASDYPHHDV